MPSERECAEEWLLLLDRALQGLHHSLNNRIGSLSAVVELQQFSDAPSTSVINQTLVSEVARLEECGRMVGLLSREAVSSDEALILSDVLADVLTIHRFIHDSREVAVNVVPTRFVEPVRAERWALLRVLTLMIADAKRAARSHGATIQGVTESDEEWVRFELRVGAPTADQAAVVEGGHYAERLAERFGGTVARRLGAIELRLPTLKARRVADLR